MREIEYRPEVDLDLEHIAIYTKNAWGKRQASRYLAALRADIESLSQFAERFPYHTGRLSTLRKMRSGHHLVFYEVTDERVFIVRVLHERMEVDDPLGTPR